MSNAIAMLVSFVPGTQGEYLALPFIQAAHQLFHGQGDETLGVAIVDLPGRRSIAGPKRFIRSTKEGSWDRLAPQPQ
jgi:hypothetical protein